MQGFLSDNVRKIIAIAAVLALVCYLPFWASDYRTFQFSLVLLYAIALLGLTVLTGRSGLVSIGQGAFVAIGAYASAIAMHDWDMHYALAIPFGGLIGLVTGGFFGLPALRLTAHALTIVSISVALSLAPVIKKFDDQTGGSTGLIVKPISVPFDLPLTSDQWLYFVALIVFVSTLLVVWSLLSGRLGRAWTASRDHEIAAESMGVNLAVYRIMAFAFSGLFAGLAGGVYAVLVQFVSPESFTVNLSILLLTGLVIGGRDTIIGVIPGAFFIEFVPIWSDDITRQLSLDRDLPPSIIYGVVLIAAMFFMPDGVMGVLKRGWGILSRSLRFTGSSPQPALAGRGPAEPETLAESGE